MLNNNPDLPQAPAQLPRAACCFVLREDGKVLGVTLETELDVLAGPAADFPARYTWGTPGGGCEGHESPEDCARRELFEETGYVAGALVPLHAAVNDGCLSSSYVAHVVAAEAGAPRRAPGEGFACWIDPILLLSGPYSDFNAAALVKLGLLRWVEVQQDNGYLELRLESKSGARSERAWTLTRVAK